jgi:hypothetical protein
MTGNVKRINLYYDLECVNFEIGIIKVSHRPCYPLQHVGIGVRCGVSKRKEDGRSPPTLRAGHPRNGHMAFSGVACPESVKGLGIASLGETLGSPWAATPSRLPMHAIGTFRVRH